LGSRRAASLRNLNSDGSHIDRFRSPFQSGGQKKECAIRGERFVEEDQMKKIAVLFLVIFLCPLVASAAQIYGSLKEGGKSVGAGTTVVIWYGDKQYSVNTDQYGSYSIYVPNTGKCGIEVVFRGQRTPRFSIYSYPNPARYDFELVRDNNGYHLERR
jgi:hypothetical protein